jgi:drug/metabolite transporter (DMT)-like permease
MAMGFQLLIGAVPLALLSVPTGDVSSPTWSREFVLVLVVLSALGSSLALWLWFEALERVELRANAFTFLVPFSGSRSARPFLASGSRRCRLRASCWC